MKGLIRTKLFRASRNTKAHVFAYLLQKCVGVGQGVLPSNDENVISFQTYFPLLNTKDDVSVYLFICCPYN